MDNKQDLLRDPIWQFISVVVGIFLTFLTLSPSAQAVALVGIAIACIFLIFVFAGRVTELWRIAILFFIIWNIWSFIIAEFIDVHVPFFVDNFGLVTEGVIYSKSDIGLALLVIKYLLLFIAYFLFFLICFKNRLYLMALNVISISIFMFCVSVPLLYTPNFFYGKVLGIDLLQPKSVLGDIVCLLGIFSFLFSFSSFYLKILILVIKVIFYKVRSLVRSL